MVQIVIVTYKGARWIRPCLRSILDDTDAVPGARVMVCDNASPDETARIVRDEFSAVELIANTRNAGLSVATNIGFRLALERGASHVALLNQDVTVRPGWLRRLLEVSEQNPDYAVLTSVQLNYDGTDFDPLFKQRHNPQRWPPDARVIPAETVIGAATLTPAAALRRIGFFDPLYFLYGAESCFCRRARRFGYNIGVVPASVIQHHHQWAQDKRARRMTMRHLRGKLIYHVKNPEHGPAQIAWNCLRLVAWHYARASVRRLRPKLAAQTLGACALTALQLPRILASRRAECRGAAHMEAP